MNAFKKAHLRNHLNAVRNRDLLQTGAAGEGALANPADGLRQDHPLQVPRSDERIFRNVLRPRKFEIAAAAHGARRFDDGGHRAAPLRAAVRKANLQMVNLHIVYEEAHCIRKALDFGV